MDWPKRFALLILTLQLLVIGQLSASNTVEINLNISDRLELSYTEIRETKKWTDDEIERAITLQIPIDVAIAPKNNGYTITWKYGKGAIVYLSGLPDDAVSKRTLSLTQNIASTFGPISISADTNGRLKNVLNLPDIREAVRVQHDLLSGETESSEDRGKLLIQNALSVIIGLSDEELAQVILADIQTYFQNYGKVLVNGSLNISEINDPHPGYRQFKVRLNSEIEFISPEKDLHLTRHQTDVLDENGIERDLEKYEPITEWLTNITFAATSNLIKSYEDIRELKSQNGRFKGRISRKLILQGIVDRN